ncbi:hypothetical protein BDW66DRAFT_125471 [Aspergillus desertorum]
MSLIYLRFFGLPCLTRRKRINYQTLNYVCQEGNVLEKTMIDMYITRIEHRAVDLV